MGGSLPRWLGNINLLHHLRMHMQSARTLFVSSPIRTHRSSGCCIWTLASAQPHREWLFALGLLEQ